MGNTAEYKKKFLQSMVDVSKLVNKTEFNDRDFIAKALGIEPKKQNAKSKKALDKITENLKREGIL